MAQLNSSPSLLKVYPLVLWHKPWTHLISLPWPHKATKRCALSHFYEALSPCTTWLWIACCKQWNQKWWYWEYRMPELAVCALEPYVLECTIYSMFPKLNHQPLLSHTGMTTWISRDSTPSNQDWWAELSAAPVSEICSWSSALELLTLELLPAITGS